MIFYHGTSKENWKLIQDEGILYGRRYVTNKKGKIREVDRCTYLAVDQEEAEQYGDVVLQVEYTPTGKHDNYIEDCWQIRVYEPIELKNVKVISE